MTVFKLRIYFNLFSLVSLKPRECALECLFIFVPFHGKG